MRKRKVRKSFFWFCIMFALCCDKPFAFYVFIVSVASSVAIDFFFKIHRPIFPQHNRLLCVHVIYLKICPHLVQHFVSITFATLGRKLCFVHRSSSFNMMIIIMRLFTFSCTHTSNSNVSIYGIRFREGQQEKSAARCVIFSVDWMWTQPFK